MKVKQQGETDAGQRHVGHRVGGQRHLPHDGKAPDEARGGTHSYQEHKVARPHG
jgi:hypothetical protein